MQTEMKDPITWHSLEPGQLRLMRMKGVLFTVLACALLIVGSVYLYIFYGTLAGMAVAIPSGLISLWLGIFAPPRRYRRWFYARADDELLVRHGWLAQIETCVSFRRIQHIDVAQGPLERLCGVFRLVLNTAGTLNSKITVPGLTREIAEGLRDEIRKHIRTDI